MDASRKYHLRLQPYTHGVVATHDVHLAHAGYALQLWFHVYVEIVGEERLVVGALRTVKAEYHERAALTFHRRHTHLCHLCRQQRRGRGHLVLHVHRRHVGVGALLEINGYLRAAGVACRRGHVGHVLDTVYGFLQRHDHAFLHRLGICAAVCRGNAYGRRRDVRILFHRKRVKSYQSRHEYHNGYDHRQYRAVYKFLKIHRLFLLFCCRRRHHGAILQQSGTLRHDDVALLQTILHNIFLSVVYLEYLYLC